MKQCPKCNSACSDDDVICKNCGYLFTPAGFDSDEPPQSSVNNSNGISHQNGSNSPYGTPPQGNNPYGAPPQGNPNNPYGAAPQSGFNSHQNQEFGNQNNVYAQPTTNGLSIASLVLGIVGVVFSCCYAFGIIPAIISLVFGIISKKKIKESQGAQKGSGMSLAGIILSVVGILLSICVLILLYHIATDPEFIRQFRRTYRQYYGTSSTPF